MENNRPVSNYRHYRFIINRKQYGGGKITDITDVTVKNKKWHRQDHGRMLEVHIYPSIHFFVSRSRSVVDCAHIQVFTLKLPQDHGRLTGEHISEHSR